MATDLRSIWVLAHIRLLEALRPDLKVAPWLSEKWEISQDGLNYTFYLRKGVNFNDSSELTSGDAVFTYKYGIGNNAPRYLGLYQFIYSYKGHREDRQLHSKVYIE
jgi:ABC-type transport system substrate-binding protein